MSKVKVVISGYGKMGRAVEGVLSQMGIECAGKSESIKDFDKEIAKECVCIDFTVPAAFRSNYRFLAENFKAVVVGTTGWDDIRPEVIDYFEKCGTPMVYASNFSIGVNVFFALAQKAASMLGTAGGYESYIVEMHHCHKLDAPSGTAKTLGALVEAGLEKTPDIQSVRCGEIPGIHTLGFEGTDDRITMTHEAFSRNGFARGAVCAALKTPSLEGVHEFKDIIFMPANL